MRLILRKLVERAEGFEIVGEAEDGEEGLRLFEEKRPDVVFLDVDMPRLNGVETAKRIQDMDPRAALIFATAYEGYRDEAFEVYAFDYRPKKMRSLTTESPNRCKIPKLLIRKSWWQADTESST